MGCEIIELFLVKFNTRAEFFFLFCSCQLSQFFVSERDVFVSYTIMCIWARVCLISCSRMYCVDMRRASSQYDSFVHVSRTCSDDVTNRNYAGVGTNIESIFTRFLLDKSCTCCLLNRYERWDDERIIEDGVIDRERITGEWPILGMGDDNESVYRSPQTISLRLITWEASRRIGKRMKITVEEQRTDCVSFIVYK